MSMVAIVAVAGEASFQRMYQPRTPGYRKSDAVMRWALPDRVFFACGACHILAYAFLRRWGQAGQQAV